MRKNIVKLKIYIDRSSMYLRYVQLFMIVFVFLDSINDPQIRSILDQNRALVYSLFTVIVAVGAIFLGWLDTKLGIRKEEYRNHSNENPVLTDILKEVKSIRNEINVDGDRLPYDGRCKQEDI